MNYDHGGTERARIDASVSVNPLGPPAALDGVFARVRELTSSYPEADAASARVAWAGRLGLPSEELLIGNGASELISLAVRAIAPSRVVLFDPCYSEYASAAEAAGVPIESFGLTLDGTAWSTPWERYEPREGDLVMLGQPNNPTGHLFSPEQVERIAGQGASVLVDESFLPFLADAEAMSLAGRRLPRVHVVCSLTKVFCVPGLRLGWFAGDVPTVAEMVRLRDPWAVNAIAAEAAVVLAEEDAYLAETRAWLAEERPRFAAALAALPGIRVTDGVGPWVLVELPQGATSRGVGAALLGEGIAVRDASTFPRLGERWIRIGVRSRPENEEVLTALAHSLESGAS